MEPSVLYSSLQYSACLVSKAFVGQETRHCLTFSPNHKQIAHPDVLFAQICCNRSMALLNALRRAALFRLLQSDLAGEVVSQARQQAPLPALRLLSDPPPQLEWPKWLLAGALLVKSLQREIVPSQELQAPVVIHAPNTDQSESLKSFKHLERCSCDAAGPQTCSAETPWYWL